jgi:hypothetical protein
MLTNKTPIEFLRALLDGPGLRIVSSNELTASECAWWQGACDREFFVDENGYGWALVPKGYVLQRERAPVGVPIP